MIPTGLADPKGNLEICFGHVICKKALENQARMSRGQLDVQEERCSGLEFKSDP